MIEKRRNCNIELLRVVAIIFIIIHHCVINGYGLQSGLLDNTLGKNELYYLSIINSFVIIGVNIFFLISGYFGIRFSIKKFITLIVNIYIYNFVLYVIAFIWGGESICFENVKYIFFPVYKYWFVFVYLILMLLAPIINHGIDALSRKAALSNLLIFTILFCVLGFVSNSAMLGLNNGYSIVFAVYLYCIGRAMHKYNILHLKKGQQIACWLFSSVAVCLMSVLFIYFGKNNLAWKAFAYNNIFVVISAINFVYIFINAKEINNSMIPKLSKHVLPVYYIHTASCFAYFRNILLKYVFDNYAMFTSTVFLMLFALAIFLICVLIDIVKIRMVDGKVSKIINVIVRKISEGSYV